MFGQDRIETTSAEALGDHFTVNTAAPALLIRDFAALGGPAGEDRSIVNILDQRIVAPHRDQLAYTLSKVAVAALTRIASVSLAPAIRVNGVAPGLTLPTEDYDAAMMQRLARMMPLLRLPSPDEVADAVLFAASAIGLTGQTIFVDAGAHLRAWPCDFMHLAGEVRSD
ncbi:SDR family oxidoreductase [Sphingomonas bacterium]|uniref:SDR family oxidoreductase n=1 Tax=Sphingomonas bacterium TaxID=1895847 RepID=UPI0020C70F02|nr:SDR family oxidoreductase [Sphingomonas bacterium]